MPAAYRALEVSTTTGTADLVLAGTLTGYQTFGAAGLDGSTVDYVVEALNADGSQQGAWEKGQGVYADATKTLARTTVQASSAGGAKVSLPAGNKRVFVPPPQQGDAGAAGVKGDKGDTGATGSTGPAGADGAAWRNGSGAPANGLGVNGDYYLDTATGDVYKKAAGAYSVVGNIKGPTGATGSQGVQGAAGPSWPVVVLRDIKTQNTAGGTFTSGAWRTRDLTEEAADTGGVCNLSANQFTLPVGTYLCRIRCPAFYVDAHQARLYNVTDSAAVLDGTSEYAGVGTAYSVTASQVIGVFLVTGSTKTFRVEHRCQTTNATFGFGNPGNFSSEVYTVAEFLKIA